ncbi:MAG: hypothetical protein AAB861_03725 [Patescibacteria group bacterium]
MATITIRKKFTQKDELILIPRKEYEELLNFRTRQVKEVPLTSRQKRALLRARKNLAEGKFFTLNELKQKLAVKN